MEIWRENKKAKTTSIPSLVQLAASLHFNFTCKEHWNISKHGRKIHFNDGWFIHFIDECWWFYLSWLTNQAIVKTSHARFLPSSLNLRLYQKSHLQRRDWRNSKCKRPSKPFCCRSEALDVWLPNLPWWIFSQGCTRSQSPQIQRRALHPRALEYFWKEPHFKESFTAPAVPRIKTKHFILKALDSDKSA